MDIASRINWNEIDCSPLETLVLSVTEEKDVEVAVGLDDNESALLKQKGVIRLKEGGLMLDYVFAVRHLIDIIPNPWTGYEVCSRLFEHLHSKHGAKMVANNLVFILEELRKCAEEEKDRLAEKVFRAMVKSGQLRFMLLRSTRGYCLPSQRVIPTTIRTLTRADNQPLQRSLFEFVPEEEFNQLEKTVAWYLEEQEKLLWWYRNLSRQDYAVQGWRKNKIYPDFIFSQVDEEDKNDYDKVFVVETKGVYLKNEDTDYKKRVFSLCNELGEEKSWTELKLEFPEKKIVFEVLFEDEWKRRIHELFAIHSS
jgi:type III restriction enzyme